MFYVVFFMDDGIIVIDNKFFNTREEASARIEELKTHPDALHVKSFEISEL